MLKSLIHNHAHLASIVRDKIHAGKSKCNADKFFLVFPSNGHIDKCMESVKIKDIEGILSSYIVLRYVHFSSHIYRIHFYVPYFSLGQNELFLTHHGSLVNSIRTPTTISSICMLRAVDITKPSIPMHLNDLPKYTYVVLLGGDDG